MLLILGFLTFAHAKDEQYLLGDLGVKIDPAGWNMDRWSDWDFRATSADGAVVLGVWSTEIQTDLGTDAAAWSPAIEAKLVEFGAREPKLATSRIDPGPPGVARTDFTFSLPGDQKGNAYGATLVIGGSNLQVVAMTRGQTAARAKSLLESTLHKLELRKAPLAAPEGPLDVSGHAVAPPAGWRKPLEAEAETVLAEVNAIGGEELTGCGWMIRPIPASKPAIFLMCPSRQHLTVVDALTVADVGAEIAPRLFGKAAPPPVALLELPDRNGLAWTLPASGKGMRMALIPTGTTAMRAWIASPVDGPELDTALQAALAATTWAAPHEVVFGEQASYYLSYKPLSAEVLCPATGVLCPLGLLASGGAFAGLAWSRRKKKATGDLD